MKQKRYTLPALAHVTSCYDSQASAVLGLATAGSASLGFEIVASALPPLGSSKPHVFLPFGKLSLDYDGISLVGKRLLRAKGLALSATRHRGSLRSEAWFARTQPSWLRVKKPSLLLSLGFLAHKPVRSPSGNFR